MWPEELLNSYRFTTLNFRLIFLYVMKKNEVCTMRVLVQTFPVILIITYCIIDMKQRI